MLAYLRSDRQELPFIHIVDETEKILLNAPMSEWYKILYYFPWQEYRVPAARYYDALYEFNIQEAKKRNAPENEGNVETREAAKQRLLFERTTMDHLSGKKTPILYQGIEIDPAIPLSTNPEEISPGKVPNRLVGKKPKCFFALFKSFIGASLMGFEPEPERVYMLLQTNPAFARVCGFILKEENTLYDHEQTPSLRKLEQFDAIMRDYGIWDQIKWKEVEQSIIMLILLLKH